MTQAQLDALFGDNTSKSITPAKLRTFVDAMFVRSKYLIAAATVGGTGRVHMKADDDALALSALVPLDPMTATQDDVDARLLTLQASYIGHCAGVGSLTVDGEHWSADVATVALLAALTPPTDLTTCIAFIGSVSGQTGFAAIIQSHGGDDGHHFHPDVTAGGNNFTLTVDPPATLGDCATDTNDVLASLILHYNQASE